jgi:hypothetical protein
LGTVRHDVRLLIGDPKHLLTAKSGHSISLEEVDYSSIKAMTINGFFTCKAREETLLDYAGRDGGDGWAPTTDPGIMRATAQL